MDRDHGKVALVHHWLLSMTGGEQVCEAIWESFGKPDIHCLVADPRRLSPILKGASVNTSFIQSLPFAKKCYRYYAPLFPLAVELLDLRAYDLVISSDASVVKGVLTGPETCHICYCHNPMRHAWNLFPEHLQGINAVKKLAVALTMHYLRVFDYQAAARVDYFIANSNNVKNRILKYYRRESEVIYPPCSLDRFAPSSSLGDYYLCVGRLVAYKRFELAVKAFNSSGRRLVVVGEGPEKASLKASAKDNIQFLGWVSDAKLASLYAKCKALVFPGEEDFGIVPLEAQASGRPVIAYGRGGALETIVPRTTGQFFDEEHPDALNAAVDELEHTLSSFDPQKIRENAARFSRERFQREFRDLVRRTAQRDGLR